MEYITNESHFWWTKRIVTWKIESSYKNTSFKWGSFWSTIKIKFKESYKTPEENMWIIELKYISLEWSVM